MMVPVFIYNIITVDFYQLWLNFNVTSTKNIDVISTTLFRRFFDVASTKNIDVISTTLFRRLIDVVLRVMTSWRHSNVYSTSYRRHVPTGVWTAQSSYDNVHSSMCSPVWRTCDEAADAIYKESWVSFEKKALLWSGLDKLRDVHATVDWGKSPIGQCVHDTYRLNLSSAKKLEQATVRQKNKSSTLENTWNCGHCHKSSVLLIRSYQPLKLT